tara:strand:+ start:1409 stop:3532 length:2124 start_codon:yes stop_codon:yes gene_type:complete
MEFHPIQEKLVNILCEKTQNTNPLFFRISVSYYFATVAAMMRANVATLDGGDVPINMYTVNLSTSGSGKGVSTNFMEEKIINQFEHNFMQTTMPLIAQQNLPVIANQRAIKKSTDPDDELARLQNEYVDIGDFVYSFDSGSAPAIKAARHKCLLASVGSLNLQIDEIGSNLTGNVDALNAFLELFDVGKIKGKLTKNSSDNKRVEEIKGATPTNMMLFGTPSRLLNGGKAEDEFYSMLDTGYSRRCFFGYARGHTRNNNKTPEEILKQRTNNTTSADIEAISDAIGKLADPTYVNKSIAVSEQVTLLLIEYQLNCERLADELPEHEEMKKAELSHRWWKALKLAGAYAFIDDAIELTEDHIYYAIKLAEESGTAFGNLLTRDRPYVKLAKYIANVNRSITQADLVEDLPFYRGAASQKTEMMQLAIAYGYQNNILIKKSFVDGIEFLRGESLTATNLEEMRVSYSSDIAKGYKNETAPFDQLHLLTQSAGMHWVNHHLVNGHRKEENVLTGFNMIVIDVDKGVNLSTAQMLLKDYKALFYTTKRHTEAEHRFRIVMPINYELKLDAKEYKEFMSNLFQWLPFEVDEATNQRARKWLSNNGPYYYQDGDVLDILPFIPKTSKNEKLKEKFKDQKSLDNLERWVINNTGDGNRNNQLLRYAYVLVDAGYDFEGIRQRVTSLNDKLVDKLDEAEILGTIMVTVGKKLSSI